MMALTNDQFWSDQPIIPEESHLRPSLEMEIALSIAQERGYRRAGTPGDTRLLGDTPLLAQTFRGLYC